MTPEQRAELRIRAEIPGIWVSKVVNDLLDDLATLTHERDEAEALANDFRQEVRSVRARLERERDEALKRAELLRNGWDQFVGALEGEIPGIEWKTKAEIDDATTWTNFGSMAEQIYAYAIEDGRNYDREFADTAEKERDEQRQRTKTAERERDEARKEVERLRTRTHEIQEAESKRLAKMESELAEYHNSFAEARKMVNSDQWNRDSYYGRFVITEAIRERDEARREVGRLMGALAAMTKRTDHYEGGCPQCDRLEGHDQDCPVALALSPESDG